MRESMSQTCSSPFVIGHQWPSRWRRRTALLWRQRSLQFTEKMPMPARQLPINGFAHKTAVIGDLRMRAVVTALDMAAESRRAAALDRRHHLQLAETDMTGIGLPPCRAMVAEEIRDLQGGMSQDCPGLYRRLLFQCERRD